VDVPLPVLMDAYLQAIATKAAGTRDAYRRILRDLSTWLAAKPGGAAGFVPDQLTQTAVTIYLEQLQAAGYSRSHCARVKAVISGFARYLIEEPGVLRRNPTRGVSLPPAAALAPRELSIDQRFVLRSLAEREGTTRCGDLRLGLLGRLPGQRCIPSGNSAPPRHHQSRLDDRGT